jgi:hypoxanthine phosphoribosyltransferase
MDHLKDICGRGLIRDIETHLPVTQRKFLDEYRKEFAGVLIPQNEIIEQAVMAANRIGQHYRSMGVDTVVVPVMLTGGLGPYRVMEQELYRQGLRLILDSVGYSRYGGNINGNQANEIVKPKHIKKGRHVLFLEDVIDEGKSMNDAVAIARSFNPASVNIFSLTAKPDKVLYDKVKENFGADNVWVAFYVDDHWLVGCGMDLTKEDFQGDPSPFHRSLPWIGAANPDYVAKTNPNLPESKIIDLRRIIHFQDES